MHKDGYKEYMILSEVLPGDRGRTLLGSVIYHTHHTRPDDNYVPNRTSLLDEDRAKVERLFEKVWDDPKGHVGLEDLTRDRSNTWAGHASAQIDQLFKGWIKRNKGQSYIVTAGRTKRYTIPNVGQELKNYVNCGPWWDKVREHYDQADPQKRILYLITGVWLCSQMIIQESETTSRGAGAGANLTAGQPGLSSIAAEAEVNQGYTSKRGERIPEEVVFAIKCHSLELREEDQPTKRAGWFNFGRNSSAGKTLVGLRLGLPVPGSPSPYAGRAPQADADESSHPELQFFYIARPAFASMADIPDEDAAVSKFNAEAF